MNRFLLFLLLSSFTLVHAQQTKRVLFLGNSYTNYNNLPVLIDNLANAAGNDIIRDSNTPGGYTFNQHANSATTLTKIKAQDWDFVVLQAQSQEPSFSPAQVANQTYPYAAILNDSILANNPCTEPLFYMTWGRKNGDVSNCGSYPPICTYDGMQQRLRESYLEMAQANDASVAPVGVAWKIVRDLYPTIELYNPDESHPSLAGSYLAACVFYASIFRESAVGNSFVSNLDSLTAYRLQSIASATVLDSLSLWHIGDNDLGLSLPADTSLCGDSLTITAQNVMGNLLWSTNETTNSITVMNSVLLSANVSNARTCSISDSTNVDLNTGYSTTVNYTACDSLELAGVVYFEDTLISDSFVLANGCDSVFQQIISIVAPLDILNNHEVYVGVGEGSYIYVNEELWDSIYFLNDYENNDVINEDSIYFNCAFIGYILAWNQCGMDSVDLYYTCAAVKDLDNTWTIGPNPTKELLQISSASNKGFSIKIFDWMGRIVYSEEYQQTQLRELNINDLSLGVYQLVLFDKEAKSLGTKTIQKQ